MADLVLTIVWSGPGTPLTVNGPINDKMICYAMLEGAKDAIREHVTKNASPIQVVGPLNGLKRD